MNFPVLSEEAFGIGPINCQPPKVTRRRIDQDQMAQGMLLKRIAMPDPPARVKFDSNINPAFNPNINPKANAALNPMFNCWINPQRNSRISPKTNRSLDPLVTTSLNPTANSSLDPKHTSKYSGLRRWTPEAELIGYIVNTHNKAVLLLFDKDLEWTAYAIDNMRQGYNIFDRGGDWKGYILKNAAGGLNEFNLDADWVAFIM
jgi:hypothetical protein